MIVTRKAEEEGRSKERSLEIKKLFGAKESKSVMHIPLIVGEKDLENFNHILLEEPLQYMERRVFKEAEEKAYTVNRGYFTPRKTDGVVKFWISLYNREGKCEDVKADLDSGATVTVGPKSMFEEFVQQPVEAGGIKGVIDAGGRRNPIKNFVITDLRIRLKGRRIDTGMDCHSSLKLRQYKIYIVENDSWGGLLIGCDILQTLEILPCQSLQRKLLEGEFEDHRVESPKATIAKLSGIIDDGSTGKDWKELLMSVAGTTLLYEGRSKWQTDFYDKFIPMFYTELKKLDGAEIRPGYEIVLSAEYVLIAIRDQLGKTGHFVNEWMFINSKNGNKVKIWLPPLNSFWIYWDAKIIRFPVFEKDIPAIMIDPPWNLGSMKPTRGTTMNYPMMNDVEIYKSLDLKKFACGTMVFFWTLLPKRTQVAEWAKLQGFSIKEEIVWVKRD